MVSFKLKTSDLNVASRRIERALSDDSIEKILLGGAMVFERKAKANAPVDDGNLRQSIHIGGHTAKPHTDTEEPWNSHIDIKKNGRFGSKIQLMIGSSIIYANAQEYGVRIATNPGMRRKLRMLGYLISESTSFVRLKAQPYMRPAFNSGWRPALAVVKKMLKARIKSATR